MDRQVNIHELEDRVTALEIEIHGRKTCIGKCDSTIVSPASSPVVETIQDDERAQDRPQLDDLNPLVMD